MFLLRQYFLLFLTAAIWGSGFVAQKTGIEHVSPYTFTFMRTLIGGLCLLPLLAVLNVINSKKQVKKTDRKMFIYGSMLCGFFLILSESLQQYGLLFTDVNKASFITALYMVFVPIIGLFAGHRLTLKLTLAVALSCLGLYLFCMKGEFSLAYGDTLVLLCALGFAFHILVISFFINIVDGVMLSCGQFFVASFLGFIMMALTGMPKTEELMMAAPAILYAGIMSNGIAYTLQIVGQKGVNPTIASLILSLESVNGAIFGVIMLNESMSAKEITGAVLMFSAIVLTQIRLRKRLFKKTSVALN